MTYAQEARDGEMRHQIIQSCRVIKSHASFVGVSADKMVRMPNDYTPVCMDELNEAEGVLRRAMDRIERAKQTMLAKVPAEAAE